MPVYTVTAANKFFYMRLAVQTETTSEAEALFRAYLDATRGEEDYEWSQGEKLGLDERHDRADYRYDFDAETISDNDRPTNYYGATIGPAVAMTGSGGNG